MKNLSSRKNFLAVTRATRSAQAQTVEYLTPEEVYHIADAIERLRQTGNPKALQLHLGHSSIKMTMRYLSTLSQEDAVKINQEVEFNRKG